MNAGIKLAAVYVAGAILVAGCGQNNSGSAGTSPGQPAAAVKPATPKGTTIKIKGIYVGMDIQSVPALLKEKLAGKDWIITDAAKGSAIINLRDKSESLLTDAEKQIVTSQVINFASVGIPVPYFPEPEDFYVFIAKTFASGGWISAGPDGKVAAILLRNEFVNDSFNAADMDASAFVKQFISAYDIPEMKVSDNLQSWTYTSPDGVKVTIDTQKNVSLEKVASAQDRKQSFN